MLKLMVLVKLLAPATVAALAKLAHFIKTLALLKLIAGKEIKRELYAKIQSLKT